VQVTSVRTYQAGYEIRTEQLTEDESGVPGGMEMKSAYTPEGHYIGSSKRAYHLIVKRGIKPEPQEPANPSSNGGRGRTCSIGFCEREQKWYGWSHRAIYGFGIGDTVQEGDCAYVPANMMDFIRASVTFWKTEHHIGLCVEQDVEQDGIRGMQLRWEYDGTVPNQALRGTISSVFIAYPDEFGQGEWTAETLEDAKQMACDFAESVA
jgi:hypothetical protein